MTGPMRAHGAVLVLLLGCTSPAPDPERAAAATSDPGAVAAVPEVETEKVAPTDGSEATGASTHSASPANARERRTYYNPGGGTSLIRTTHIREVDEGRAEVRNGRRDGAPRLQIVALGTDLMVRLINDRPRTTWISTHPPAPGPEPRMFIELVAVDAGGESSTTRHVVGSGGMSALIKIPPDTTLDLGRARAFEAQGKDREDWLRIVFEDDAMVQTTGSRARLHARWSGSPSTRPPDEETVARLRAMYRDAEDLVLEDLFVMSTEDVSNTVEIVAEPEAGVVHPTEPTAERLPMPEELRETARELGLE